MSKIEFEPLEGNFGSRALGVEVATDSGIELVRILAARLFRDRILVIPGQNLSNEVYADFGRRWGRPILVLKKDHRVGGHSEIIRQSNSSETPLYIRNAANHWHSDSMYEAESATVTMLYGVESPVDGGETLFADTVAAYDALDPQTKSVIADLRARHRAGGGEAGDGETIPKHETWTRTNGKPSRKSSR